MTRESAGGMPKNLRPYLFHGVELRWRDGEAEAVGACPWCGRDGKFNVSAETGQWRCWVCQEGSEKGGGNVYVFLRKLWELSDRETVGYEDLAEDRRMLHQDTLMRWGVCRSSITGSGSCRPTARAAA